MCFHVACLLLSGVLLRSAVSLQLSMFSVCDDESLPGMAARKTLKLFHDVMSSSDNPLHIVLSSQQSK